MRLATWNVNSLKQRVPRLLPWLDERRPDVVCLQETKLADAALHELVDDALSERGYEVAAHGEATWNGVAILSRVGVEDVRAGIEGAPGFPHPEARAVSATCAGIRVVCVYVPNGQELASDKYTYKLAWYRRLRAYLDRTATATTPLVLCGDFNVTSDDLDVWSPEQWAGKIHCSVEERAALGDVLAFGLVDVFRKHNPAGKIYSWWDYRGVSLFKNQGLRIDFIFATEPVAAQISTVTIDREARKGQDASDHAPVIASLD